MTNERLEELRKLCDAATRGPWDFSPASDEWKANGKANANFCRASRTAVPELIDEVAKLRDDYLRADYERDSAVGLLDEIGRKLEAENAKLTDEVAKLRGALKVAVAALEVWRDENDSSLYNDDGTTGEILREQMRNSAWFMALAKIRQALAGDK